MGLEPRTQFVARGDAHLAYQVYGQGPPNLLYLSGIGTHVEQLWQFPFAVRATERLGALARVAMYDVRGYGMSDPLPSTGYPIDEFAADAIAVADAAGFDRSVLYADFMAGAVAVWLAVHCPERVDALVLQDATACLRMKPGYEIGFDEQDFIARRDFTRSIWGTGETISLLAPSIARDDRVVEEWARYERIIGTPGAVVASYEASSQLDARDLLPRVSVPTLVIHSVTNGVVPVEHGRYLAEHIPGARYVEASADVALEWASGDIGGDVAELLTGNRAAAHFDRSLQVVLFSDIVGSTNRASTMGDKAWRDLLSDFRRCVRAVLDRYQATEVNTTGDSFFAVVPSPSVAVEVATAIRSESASLGLAVRSGMHLGEVERHGDDLAGIAVHLGARIEALAEPGEILVSQTVRDALVGSATHLTNRGTHHLKGVPGEWQVFAVTDAP